jgi:hypothetical protein
VSAVIPPGVPVGPQRITLIAAGHEVTIESATATLPETMEAVLDLLSRAEKIRDRRPRVEAGGMGFETERADGPAYGDDAPGTVRT